MSTAACPRCGAKYLATVSVCADCGVGLVEAEAESQEADEAEADDVVAPAEDEVAYDLADWLPEQRQSLTARLEADGIAARWDLDEVVVAEADADVTEELIDEIDHPDALPLEDEDGSGGGDVLSALYVASDVLAGDPENGTAVVELLEAAEVAAEAVPYGLDGETWRQIRTTTDELADLLGEGGSDDEVAATARRLRDLVRSLV